MKAKGRQSEPGNNNLVPPEMPAPESYRMALLPPYLLGAVNALNDKLRAQGHDIIDLGMGNPVDPVPPEALQQLSESLADPGNHRYANARGIIELRRAAADFYARRYNVELNPEEEVIAAIGSKEAFSHLCLSTMGPGDLCVVPTPAFTMHRWPPMIAGAHVRGVKMVEEEPGPQLLDDLTHVFETEQPRPKFLILNFPHNPTAKMVDLSFFEEIADRARRFGFWVIHDFAYGMTCFDGKRAPSFLQAKGAKEVGVETMTMSKQYNMAGWRIGFMFGHRRLIGCLARIKGYFDYGLFKSAQLGAIRALNEGDEFIEKQAAVYEKRRDVLLESLTEAGWGNVRKQSGTMFSWQELPACARSLGSLQFCLKLAENAGVSFTPGAGFGVDGEGFVRIALVADEDRLREAGHRIKGFLQEL